jgi:hypothetical protein
MKPTESEEQGVDLETPLDFIFEIVAKPVPATDLNAYKLPYPEYIPIIRQRRRLKARVNEPLLIAPPEDLLWSLEHCTDASELPDYFQIDSAIRVASDRFKALVERFAVPNVDFYPLRLELKRPDQVDSYGGGAIIEQGYWIMDDYHHLDVVDTDRSEISWMEKYDKFEDAVREADRRFPDAAPVEFGKIKNLVLKTQGTPDHFFRMRYFTPRTFGSAAFVKAIIDDGMNVLIRPFLLHPARELEIRSAAEKVRHEMAHAGQPVMAVPPRRHYGTGALYPRGFYYSGKNIAADKGMSDVVIETVIGR